MQYFNFKPKKTLSSHCSTSPSRFPPPVLSPPSTPPTLLPPAPSAQFDPLHLQPHARILQAHRILTYGQCLSLLRLRVQCRRYISGLCPLPRQSWGGQRRQWTPVPIPLRRADRRGVRSNVESEVRGCGGDGERDGVAVKGGQNRGGGERGERGGIQWEFGTQVLSGGGTPARLHGNLTVYLFPLFNENKKAGPTSERNFGMFYPDEKKVYEISMKEEGEKEGRREERKWSGEAADGIGLRARGREGKADFKGYKRYDFYYHFDIELGKYLKYP